MLGHRSTQWLQRLPHAISYSPLYLFRCASEVLTDAHQLRTVLDLPIPRVYTYSLDPDNLVGAEYILEEKAPGEPLGNLWYDWPIESRYNLIDQLVDFESKVKSIWFRNHGCLYFKKDMAHKKVPFREPEPLRETFCEVTEDINVALLDDFVIGPLTEAVLWGEKQWMELDRGPCTSNLSIFQKITNPK